MKKRFKANIMILLVLALLVVNVFAATPGSACSVTITGPLGLRVVEPGIVSPNGSACAPVGERFFGLPVGVGVSCGFQGRLLGVNVVSRCPN
jgi:hypothetical protein